MNVHSSRKCWFVFVFVLPSCCPLQSFVAVSLSFPVAINASESCTSQAASARNSFWWCLKISIVTNAPWKSARLWVAKTPEQWTCRKKTVKIILVRGSNIWRLLKIWLGEEVTGLGPNLFCSTRCLWMHEMACIRGRISTLLSPYWILKCSLKWQMTIVSETSVIRVASASVVCWWSADSAVCWWSADCEIFWWSAKWIPLRHFSCHYCAHQVTVQVIIRDYNVAEAS